MSPIRVQASMIARLSSRQQQVLGFLPCASGSSLMYDPSSSDPASGSESSTTEDPTARPDPLFPRVVSDSGLAFHSAPGVRRPQVSQPLQIFCSPRSRLPILPPALPLHCAPGALYPQILQPVSIFYSAQSCHASRIHVLLSFSLLGSVSVSLSLLGSAAWSLLRR
jgi:hypothetical protein